MRTVSKGVDNSKEVGVSKKVEETMEEGDSKDVVTFRGVEKLMACHRDREGQVRMTRQVGFSTTVFRICTTKGIIKVDMCITLVTLTTTIHMRHPSFLSSGSLMNLIIMVR